MMFGLPNKKETQPTLVETKKDAELNLIRLAEEITLAWEEAYLSGSKFMPWISWPDKEIQIVTRSNPKPIK